MIAKNEEYTGTVEAFGSNGEGILHNGGFTVFIPFAMSGETVRYKILKVSGTVAFAKLLEVVVPSSDRVQSVCPVFCKCGGCQLQHVGYAAQLRIKRDIVSNCLKKIAFIDFPVDETVPSDAIYGYRNKLQLPVRRGKDGTEVGFFAPNSHRVVPIESCAIHPAWSADVIACIKKFCAEYGVSAYDEERRCGAVKHVVAREVGGRMLITVVVNSDDLKERSALTAVFKERFSDLSLFLNFNKSGNNVVLGKKFVKLCGEDKYVSEEFGIRYGIGPESFMQINDGMRVKLYSAAIEAAAVSEKSVVIDAYSGAGLLTAIFAKRCKKAIGVEIVREAVDCADALMRDNGIENMENICAPCEDVLPDLLERERATGSECVLVLDPPRQGADVKVIDAVLRSLPDKIIYVSCSPQTLSRDLGLLLGTLERDGTGAIVKAKVSHKSPYKLISVTPFDLFPQTKHVETLVCLSHKKPDGHISVNVEFGEEEGQVSLKDIEKRALERAPKKKTTYKDIQAYIEEKYGFKVHTAYIAEVKRDLGLPMYDAPNAVEELKRSRSHPTAEMVEAIKDALKHFEII